MKDPAGLKPVQTQTYFDFECTRVTQTLNVKRMHAAGRKGLRMQNEQEKNHRIVSRLRIGQENERIRL